MRQLTFVAIASAIAIAVGGCASEETASDPAATPAPVASPAAPKPAGSPAFGKPLVAQKTAALNTPGSTVPGLIQSTNAAERAKQVQASINRGLKPNKDPFVALPVLNLKPRQPNTATTTAGGGPTGGGVPSLPGVPNVGGSREGGAIGVGTSSPVASRPLPPNPSSPLPNRGNRPGSTSLSPNTPSISKLPPLPTATLANTVEVTGVVNVGGIRQAIVKAPNEETSRYVREGQRLSGGQILVKRIDLTGAEPVVILEENGVEVSRPVGEKVAPPQKTA